MRQGPPVHARRVFLWAPPYFAEGDLENTQSTANSGDCSFESQRYDRDGFSGFHHFPQLVVLLGLPWTFAVSGHHFNRGRKRRPHWARHLANPTLCGRPIESASSDLKSAVFDRARLRRLGLSWAV